MVSVSRSTEHVTVADRAMRVYVARPQEAQGKLPAVIAWSDIFQLTPPHLRMVERIASYGFLVFAPEIYSKLEPGGTVHDFERDRQRALEDAAKLDPVWIDEERRALIDHLLARSDVDPDRLAVCGWCFGGHLAFRAALEAEVKAAACFYGTGLHSRDLGTAKGSADTLDRSAELRASLLLVWGTADPHIPEEGRRTIHRKLAEAGARFQVRLFAAEHAFMRDVGPRWDPEATDAAFMQMIDHFRRELQ
jgi:carboxymethylenebutenolidase